MKEKVQAFSKPYKSRYLKVLFAPSNIASFSSILSRALNKIPGVMAKGISLGSHKYQSYSEEWTIVNYKAWRKNPFRRFVQTVYANFKLLHLIVWADVIQWQWDIKGQTVFNLHYWLIKFSKKPMVVEWVGSDIRIPEMLFQYNPFYKQAWQKGEYEYTYESRERSLAIQKRFKKLNAIPAVVPEMSLFLDRTLFPNFFLLNARIDVNEYEPNFPDPAKKNPVIVHTPSAFGAKGTRRVRQIIQSLQAKGLKFEYVEISNMSKKEALAAIKEADIFLDQFIVGSFGMAACEAMAMGKPTFCYLMPAVRGLLPIDCPIVGASLNELELQLQRYIEDACLRKTTGMNARAYVEKYHNADTIAQECYRFYKALLAGDFQKVRTDIQVARQFIN